MRERLGCAGSVQSNSWSVAELGAGISPREGTHSRAQAARRPTGASSEHTHSTGEKSSRHAHHLLTSAATA